MLKIGDIELDVPFFQAPLSGYTDRPMRVLARQFGAPLTFTGVLLDKISLHPRAVRKLLSNPGPDESPVGAQILGANPETMAKAAVAFEEFGFDLVDLNFACPAPKVLRRGRGGALLGTPDTAIEIYKRVRDAVKCPVSVKLRIGIKNDDGTRENFWRICEEIVAYGADALVVHGRTVTQKYRGEANWDILAQVKKQFNDTIVVGSGDILTAEDAIKRYEESGVDGVLIARGAIGNPWIFTDARALFNGQEKPPQPPLKEQGEVILRHFEMILEMHPEIKAIRYFRKFAVGYCRRHPQRKKVQMELMECRKADAVRAVVTESFCV
jgi:tRNA-dihydrouridine synthase B